MHTSNLFTVNSCIQAAGQYQISPQTFIVEAYLKYFNWITDEGCCFQTCSLVETDISLVSTGCFILILVQLCRILFMKEHMATS